MVAARADHFVDVDAHAVGDDLHLVDEPDVDRAMDVLQQLGHFGGAGGTDRHHLLDRAGIKRDAGLRAVGGDAAANLRDVPGTEPRIARVFPLRRENEKDVFADFEICRLDARQQFLFRRPWVSGAFEGYDLSSAKKRNDGVGGGDDEAEVRLAVAIERRRNADDDGIRVAAAAYRRRMNSAGVSIG